MYATKQQVMATLKLADDSMQEAKQIVLKLRAQVDKLTSERDIFSAEVEHWRALAYKLAGPKEPAPTSNMVE